MNTAKWYNVELPYNTKTAIEKADNFKMWLDENNIKCEPSACFDMVHFEILLNPKQIEQVNNALDRIVWYDAIL